MQGAPWEDMQRAGPTRQVSAGEERGGVPMGCASWGGRASVQAKARDGFIRVLEHHSLGPSQGRTKRGTVAGTSLISLGTCSPGPCAHGLLQE